MSEDSLVFFQDCYVMHILGISLNQLIVESAGLQSSHLIQSYSVYIWSTLGCAPILYYGQIFFFEKTFLV